MRALRGDKSDFPHRQHEELLYPTKAKEKAASLEPQEAAPSPILPLVVSIEELSQLNLPPVEVPVVKEEVSTPTNEMVLPQAPTPAPVAPPTGPAVEQPQPPVVAPQEPQAPVEMAPQSMERLKQAEQEGLKLLSKTDEPVSPNPDKEHVPTLPEIEVADAESPQGDEQVDLFDLFGSFTSSLAEEPPREKNAQALVAEEGIQEGIPEDNNSTPPDENLQAPSEEPSQPEQPHEEAVPAEESLVAEAEEKEVDAIEETEEEEIPTPSSWQSIFSSEEEEVDEPEAQDEIQDENIDVAIIDEEEALADAIEEAEAEEPEAQNEIQDENVDLAIIDEEEALVDAIEEAEAEENEEPEPQNEIQNENKDENVDVAIIEEEEEAAPTQSWWDALFSSADEEEQENALQEERDLPELALEELQEAQIPDTESAESWWQRLFLSKEKQQSKPLVNEEALHQTEALFFMPRKTAPGMIAEADTSDHDEPLIYDEEDQAAVHSMPNVTMEHVQVDTDEAIGNDDDAHDPVLKSLYSEPLRWMQTRASSEPVGIWGDPQEELASQESSDE
jgi:hypothetical protein